MDPTVTVRVSVTIDDAVVISGRLAVNRAEMNQLHGSIWSQVIAAKVRQALATVEPETTAARAHTLIRE